MEATELQQIFFTHLKSALPAHVSIADELCDLLGISADSAYRRLRGEKPLTLYEMKLICEKYHMSVDQLLQLQNDSILFQAPDISQQEIPFADYLRGLLGQLKYFNSFKDRQMLYLCKDMIYFHFYLYPEFAAFKTFFWLKTILNKQEYNHKKFSLAEFSFPDCFSVGQEMIKEYNKIPSAELWNFESINSSISQLKYYKDSSMFGNPADFSIVVDSFIRTLDHQQSQTEKGMKFMPGDSELVHRAPIKFYVNEVVLGNNTILLELNNNQLSFITYNVFSYLITRDHRFTNKAFASFNTLLSRSTLISATGEKERNRFFNAMRDKVNDLKK
ncbi:MAG TPA: helix-turn-helix domain-containing protein [Chitinophagaceae bacterium]|jgi:hypothetical protein|nr:helix-turn-helix domain-containing protein [Chitinophagaceae bacterium]